MLFYTTISRFLFALALLLLTALTISCGGGGGGGGSGGSTAPTVTAVSPMNGANGVASNVTISAGFSTPMNGATLTPDTFKLAMGATPVDGAINYTGLTATFTPNADLPAATYTATITTGVKDVAGNALAAAYTWSFSVSSAPDIDPPIVSSTIPVNGVTGVALNGTVTATFSETINAATLTNASFTLTGPGPSDVLSGTVTYDVASRTARFSPSQALKNFTIYTAKISTGVTDAAGNALAADYIWTFTTVADTTPPTVLSTFPANGATGVATNSTITANFSEPMAIGSLIAATFTLSNSTGPVSGGTITSNGSSATLSVGLLANTAYTATITTGATDAAGNALASDYSWSFTTAATPDTTPPSVVSINPVDGATGISRSTTVSAIFSEAMNPSTLTTSVFTLTNTGPVAASINYNPATLTATLTPNSILAPLATYTAQISAGAQDAAGNPLPLTTWSFTTRDGKWGSAQTIESDTGDAHNPSIAFDSNGNAFAVWQQNNGTRIDIFANRYSAATASWGTPEPITDITTNTPGLDAINPKIAISSSGEAIAVWQQNDGTRNNIWFNRFAGAWGTAAVVELAAGEAVNPQIAFDASNVATAVWQQFDGARTNIYSSRYTAAWSAPTALAHTVTDNMGNAENPQVAISANGSVMVVWQQLTTASPSSIANIWANRYVAGAWGTAAKIEADEANSARYPHVAIDSSGNVLAVWQQTNGTINSIWANRYDAAGTGWLTAGTIENDSNPAISPHAAMDASGNSIVVWAALSPLPSQRYNFYANRLASADFLSGSWGAAELIETASAGGVQDPQPQIMFDGNGHALAVWHDGDDVNGFGLSIWSNRYVAGTGWGAAQLIENVSTANASSPRLAVDNNGNAFAIWSQSDGRRANIYINRFQ